MVFGLFVLVGCGAAPGTEEADGGESPGCSQTHRELSRWQDSELDDCGPDVTGMRELTPIGNHQLLARRRFGGVDDVWQVGTDGTLPTTHATAGTVNDARTAGLTLLPGARPLVLAYQPRAEWVLYEYPPNTDGSNGRAVIKNVSWREAAILDAPPPNLWGHELLGLADGYVLDCNLGDGSLQVWRFVNGSTDTIDLQPPGSLKRGPDDRFRRGHRLVLLGPGRVLEWMPRPCPAGAKAPCDGADYRVFAYSMNGGAFTLDLRHAGHWPDIGAESDLVGDGDHLFVWTRGTGRLRSYALDPDDAGNPLANVLGDLAEERRSVERRLEPAHRSAAHQAPRGGAAGRPLVRLVFRPLLSGGAERPRRATGLLGGTGLLRGDARAPALPRGVRRSGGGSDLPAGQLARSCLRTKMHGTLMDEFGVAHAEMCGDPRDVACAPAGTDDGVGLYHALAGRGALADRFFQSYAYLEDGADSEVRRPAADPEPDLPGGGALLDASGPRLPTAADREPDAAADHVGGLRRPVQPRGDEAPRNAAVLRSGLDAVSISRARRARERPRRRPAPLCRGDHPR